MMENKILDCIKKSINNAPINILDNIKAQNIPRIIQHDEITRQFKEKRFSRKVMPMASLAATFILAIGLWQYWYKIPDSHIYLDINPSIEIITNKREQAINVLTYNSDGSRLIKDIHFKGKDIVVVTEEILQKMIDLEYMNSPDNYLLISIHNKNLYKQNLQKNKLNASIHSYMKKQAFSPIILIQDVENNRTVKDYANEYGISLSRITLIGKIIKLNSILQIEDLVDLSLEELITLSQSIGINLEDIVHSDDFSRIPKYMDTDEIYEDLKEVDDIDDLEDEIQPKENTTPAKKIISNEEAIRISLSLTKGGTIISMELDIDDEEDEAKYEIKITEGKNVYEIELDAYTGNVLEFDIDEED